MPTTSPELRDLLFWLRVIAQPDTIYRGEPECFRRVSSGLYRQLYAIDYEGFDIMRAQQQQLEVARRYSSIASDEHLLTNIQHLGGKTNLIDFTRDLNVALFFAAYRSPNKDGRIILFRPPVHGRSDQDQEYKIVRTGAPSNMADVQKSVWVVPKRGYIRDEDTTIVKVPKDLKHELTDHLQILYGVEQATVYNDISGFIRHQDDYRDQEAEVHAGITALNENQHQQAIEHFNRCIELSFSGQWRVSMQAVHHFRALAYFSEGLIEEALDDLERSECYSPRMDHLPRIPLLDVLMEQRRRERKDSEDRSGTEESESDSHGLEIVRFLIRACNTEGTEATVHLEIASEFGYGYRQTCADGRILVTVPHSTTQGRWRLWFTHDGYRPIVGLHREWPVHETLRLLSYAGDPDIIVTIQSRRYRGATEEEWQDGRWIKE